MDKPDATAGMPSASTVTDPGPHAADAVSAETFRLDLEAGPVLADILSSDPAAGTGLDDLHAALASLPNEGFADFDIALQHLTHAVDLFDLPADPGADLADGS